MAKVESLTFNLVTDVRDSSDAVETLVKVIPTQAGIQGLCAIDWIPACAGMT